MQLDDVTTALNWNVQLPFGQFILVEDSDDTSGQFLVHHMINIFLEADCFVCLVGFSHTLQHYTAVSKKLGQSITASKTKDRFSFIDQLCNTKDDPMAPTNQDDLKNIYQQFKDVIDKAGDKNVCFIVDDLTALMDSTDYPKDVLTFIKYCRAMINEKHTFLCLSQIMGTDAEEAEAKLMAEITHQADLLLVVQPLSTGYSKDIHGRISVYPFNQISKLAALTSRPLPDLLHFIVQENGVKVFIPGAH